MPTPAASPSDTRTPQAPGRPLTGRMVLVAVLAFFGLITVANIVLIRVAVSSFGGVEVASAYRAGLAFESDVAAARRQAERGWQVALSVTPARSVSVDVRDAAGRPISGLDAAVVFAHPADRRRDVTLPLAADGDGYGAPLPADLAAGQRVAILTLDQGGETVFRSVNRLMLP